jgi:hypothetical protein
MRGSRRRWLSLAPIVALLSASGCAYTVAGTSLKPITPQAPSFQPRVEHTVGDFEFTLESGKMVTSHYVGRTLSDQIMEAWKERGYIRDAQFVEAGAFTPSADYELTLNGSQYGDSSIPMQILSGLTLMLLPYSVTQNYDVQYVLEDVRSGRKYSAGVQESDKTWVELLLIFALPVAHRGHTETVRNMGDHLYEQFHRQGAFHDHLGEAVTTQRDGDRPTLAASAHRPTPG